MLQDVAIQALNVSLMLSVGLELDLDRLRHALRARGLLFAVTLINFGLIPLIALGLARGLGLSPPVAAGLLLAALAPGGGTGTLLTRTARGNLELSVVLLGLFTALAVPLVPGLALLLVPDGRLELWPLLRTLLLFQLVPLALGVTIRLVRPRWAARLDKLAKPLSNLIFGALVLALLVTRGHLVLAVGGLGAAAIGVVVLASFAATLPLPGPGPDRAALSLTTGVRNLSLALLLSSAFFDDLSTVTVLTYGLGMYLVGVPAALWLRVRRAAGGSSSHRS